MLQRVKSNVAHRFDSTRAAESELVPLTLADDNSPRSASSLDDSPSSSRARIAGFGASPLQGTDFKKCFSILCAPLEWSFSYWNCRVLTAAQAYFTEQAWGVPAAVDCRGDG